MEIRLMGTRAELAEAAAVLGELFVVRAVSGFYPNRHSRELGRLYLRVELHQGAGAGAAAGKAGA